MFYFVALAGPNCKMQKQIGLINNRLLQNTYKYFAKFSNLCFYIIRFENGINQLLEVLLKSLISYMYN